MKLIVGLGNPGEKYKNTYHNLGFLVVEALAKSPKFKVDLLNFKLDKKFESEIARGKIGSEDVILAKSQTFMNLSGQAVKKIISYYKIKTKDVWVISDDIDLPLGTTKIRKKGSSGGHRGLESIINVLHTENFVRFRLGIRPSGPVPAEKYVLQRFKPNELKVIKKSINQAKEAIIFALENNIEKAMSKFNKRKSQNKLA